MAVLENECVVIVGQQPWDTDIGSNCKDIAIELAKKNQVLYVNSPLDRITRLRGGGDPKIIRRINVIKKRESGLVKLHNGLWNLYPDCMVESINWINNQHLFDYFNKRNNKLLAESITQAMKQIGFKRFILFNDNEMFKGFYLQEFLHPYISIYYSRDYMLGVDYWRKHGERLEPLLIAKSDLCLCNSVYLADYCAQYNQHAYYVGQGCDDDMLTPPETQKRPVDLPSDGKTTIGYVGSLDSNRLDIDLIVYIAVKFPEHWIVLVGPEDDIFRSSKLHQLANVLFLGKKPIDELTAYISSFDICMNPQAVNSITIGNYPRKIDEYLAHGKPTIATHTRAMEAFASFVYLADTKDEFVAQIRRALAEDTPEKQLSRKDCAAQHTWVNSVRQMAEAINQYLEHNDKRGMI